MGALKITGVIGLLAFGFGFGTALWQYFEFGFKLSEYGIIESPVWSGTWGFPILHHGYWGFILVAVGFALFEVERRNVRNRTGK